MWFSSVIQKGFTQTVSLCQKGELDWVYSLEHFLFYRMKSVLSILGIWYTFYIGAIYSVCYTFYIGIVYTLFNYTCHSITHILHIPINLNIWPGYLWWQCPVQLIPTSSDIGVLLIWYGICRFMGIRDIVSRFVWHCQCHFIS